MKSILYSVLIFLVASCAVKQETLIDPDIAMELKQYATASELYEKDYEDAREKDIRAEYAYRTAFSAELAYKYTRAIDFYKKAVELDYGERAYVQYADMLRYLERYEEAFRLYELLFREFGQKAIYRQGMSSTRQSLDWKAHAEKMDYDLKSMPFNTSESEYSATLKDGSLFFSSDRKSGPQAKKYGWTGAYLSDIYEFNLNNESRLRPLSGINTDNNEGTQTLSSDGQEMIYSRCTSEDGDDYCALYLSRQKGNGWSSGERLVFQKENVNYSSPSFYLGDSTLIYSAQDPEGLGGYDLFIVYREGSGWGDPYILDSRINTADNEQFPASYGDTIYFSSDRAGGMGGLDIYKTYPDGKGSWVPAQNLRAPINSGGDDLHLQRINDSEYYLTSNRVGGKGRDDIYLLSINKSKDPVVVDKDPKDKDAELLYYLGGLIQSVVRENPDDPSSRILGKRPIQNASVRINYGDTTLSLTSDVKGRYLIPVKPVSTYDATAKKEGYLAQTERLNVDQNTEHKSEIITYTLNVDLEKIVVGREFVLDDIYYDFNEAYIREDAMPTLNQLAKLLRDNAELNIALGAHTDCRGDDDFNQELSQRRAQAAVDYLISLGIPSTRLSAVGYGEIRPRADCECTVCDEEQHQYNRRTTFAIVE